MHGLGHVLNGSDVCFVCVYLRFRTTTIAQRIMTEVDRKTRKKRKGLNYDEQDKTLMEFPDLSPGNKHK